MFYSFIRWSVLLIVGWLIFSIYHEHGIWVAVAAGLCYFLGFFNRGIQKLQDDEKHLEGK